MKNISTHEDLFHQPDYEKSTIPVQLPNKIIKAAWELSISLKMLDQLLSETFSDDFTIIDEQIEWKPPEKLEDEMLLF